MRHAGLPQGRTAPHQAQACRTLALKLLRRRQPILFQDPARTEPASHVFGLDRGTPIARYCIEGFLGSQRRLIRGRVLPWRGRAPDVA